MSHIRLKIAVLAAAVLGLAACGGDSGGGGAAGANEKPQDRAIGDPGAPVTVIEYASITCSHCKAWHDNIWPDVREHLIETGQVRFIFRELPTAPHDIAMAGFLIARCAPEDRYYGVIDTLFERQQQLFTSQDRRGELLAVARAAGLSEDEFNSCIRDEEQIARIDEWVEEAFQRYGVNSTPTFLINGESHVGQQPLSVFNDAVIAAGGTVPEAALEAAEGGEGEN